MIGKGLCVVMFVLVLIQGMIAHHHYKDAQKWKETCVRLGTDYACVKLEVERLLEYIRLHKGADDGS